MSILILAEHDGNHIKQSTRQAVSAAAAWQLPIHLLVAGSSSESLAKEASGIAGVAKVLHAEAAHFEHPLAEDVAALLVQLGADYKVILSAHTSFSKSVLPRVAALLDVAMVSDVVSITAPATYVRPIYAGNVLSTVESSDAIQVLTIRATSFAAATDGANAEVAKVNVPPSTGLSRWVKEDKTVSDRPELSSARVVVSGGRSLGERFNELLEPLAHRFGGALGATRAAVDAGFAPNDIQVGQTGTIVAPELYFAIGISGAMQHLAGMKDSKIIVAINHDPDAPIFQYADYGLVANLFEAVPELTAALSK
ncbi:electron transfer flavoprotein subunit alpha/FixB family protein [Methylobacillus flagellatus]|uniref:Electron transfer flavoprotein subunit alpha n=1 Tax=Methylobacillus flagellatus (strain ATCC 51484 / DSM 6875 / VKM B-1610 / KT) TaxID=265072 RepID=Q1H3E1_METFK|nr:FAD-binding protein [Methylobacillus flagellatus]ABE48996.1 electron transfer flavoprotein, alpha subunit [Methylobacillus flagellatus KT]